MPFAPVSPKDEVLNSNFRGVTLPNKIYSASAVYIALRYISINSLSLLLIDGILANEDVPLSPVRGRRSFSKIFGIRAGAFFRSLPLPLPPFNPFALPSVQSSHTPLAHSERKLQLRRLVDVSISLTGRLQIKALLQCNSVSVGPYQLTNLLSRLYFQNNRVG